MTNPLVSIIVPVFNRADLISETLQSFQAQTYTNWEAIVVDDGSTDETMGVVERLIAEDKRFKLFKRPNSHLPGGSGARNFGFNQASGEFINWFDSDDLMMADCLMDKVRVLHNNPKLDFVICEALMFREHKGNIVRELRMINGNILEDEIIDKISIQTSLPLFRKSYLKNRPLFLESLSCKQEWEFFCRLLIDKPKVEFLYKALVLYRNHDDRILKQFDEKRYYSEFEAKRSVFNLLKKKNILTPTILMFYLKTVLKILKKLIALKNAETIGTITAFLTDDLFYYFTQRNLLSFILKWGIQMNWKLGRGFSLAHKYTLRLARVNGP